MIDTSYKGRARLRREASAKPSYLPPNRTSMQKPVEGLSVMVASLKSGLFESYRFLPQRVQKTASEEFSAPH